jgi:hypothetical protein
MNLHERPTDGRARRLRISRRRAGIRIPSRPRRSAWVTTPLVDVGGLDGDGVIGLLAGLAGVGGVGLAVSWRGRRQFERDFRKDDKKGAPLRITPCGYHGSQWELSGGSARRCAARVRPDPAAGGVPVGRATSAVRRGGA